MATVQWAKKYAGVSLRDVERAANKIQTVFKKVKDRDQDGYIGESEVKAALRGKDRKTWSAVMGTFASTVGHVHRDPERQNISDVLAQSLNAVRAADKDKDKFLSANELKALKNRGQQRLVEFGVALKGTK